MRAIGFSFSKIGIEKFNEISENLKVGTEIDISGIKDVKSDVLKTKEEILEVSFYYKINYEPKVAKIEIEGKILLAADPKKAKEVLKQWKKKAMPQDFRIPLFNMILKKSSLKALALEEDLNIPLHMPMPTFKPQEKEK